MKWFWPNKSKRQWWSHRLMWHCKHSGCVWIEINSVSEWIYRHVTIINNQNDWLASLRLTYLYLFCINPFVNFIGISNDRYNRMVCTMYRIGIRVTWNSKNFVLRHGHNWYSMPVVANNVLSKCMASFPNWCHFACECVFVLMENLQFICWIEWMNSHWSVCNQKTFSQDESFAILAIRNWIF